MRYDTSTESQQDHFCYVGFDSKFHVQAPKTDTHLHLEGPLKRLLKATTVWHCSMGQRNKIQTVIKMKLICM